MISVRLFDLPKSIAALDNDAQKIVRAFAGAVYLLCCEIITRAMRRTPVATGLLRKSRFVTKPDAVATFRIEIGFSAPYAVFVNANTRGVTFNVGEDHFLDKAVAEVLSIGSGFLMQRMRSLLKAGQGIADIAELQPSVPQVFTAAELAAAAHRRARIYVRRRKHTRTATSQIRANIGRTE